MGLNIVVISIAVGMLQGLIVEGFGKAHLHTHEQTKKQKIEGKENNRDKSNMKETKKK